MTLIEFFDDNNMDNVISTLSCRPDTVVFLTYNTDRTRRIAEGYRTVLSARGVEPLFEYRSVNRNNLQSIVARLTDIVREFSPPCVVDLGGGEDLFLVAAGIVSEREPELIQLHRFNVRNNTVQDCDADGTVFGETPLYLTVHENTAVYGGQASAYEWSFDEEFQRDVRVLWDICKDDPVSWNKQMTALGAEDELFYDAVEGRFSADIFAARTELSRRGVAYALYPWVLRRLAEEGMLLDLSIEEDRLSFAYKNEQVRRVLGKAGMVLEVYVTMLLRNMEEKGEPLYYDVQTGVRLDWNGEEDDTEVENEVDVLAMKGLIPIFVSCKNGQVDVGELYKLFAVAKRFGGKYAKPVLIATDLERSGSRADYIRARAADMGIRLVEALPYKDEEELCRQLKSLWLN